jgi:3-(3-hydroxy-phenyl)propionate hydroxylase
MAVAEHAVVVVGRGPTGMMLAAELALAGVDVALVERRTSEDVGGSRGRGLNARTLELLDQRGVVDRFLAEGRALQTHSFIGVPLDLGEFPTRHNHGLGLWQSQTERLLAEWIEELGVPTIRGELVGFVQDDAGVDIKRSGAPELRAGYLVGCDGGRSLVRKTAGIGFPGLAAASSWLIGEVEMDEEPELGVRPGGGIGRASDGERIQVVLPEASVEHAAEPTLAELRDALAAMDGTDYGLRRAASLARFTDAVRQAESYRAGRVLIAGDAAHVHPPQGGQGANLGIQDAVNLGWKLAQVVHGTSPDALLDTYHAEQHPVGSRALRMVLAQVVLLATDERTTAAREFLGDLLGLEEPRRRLAGMMAGLDIRHALGDGHPLLGRRMPDLDLVTAAGPVRMFELMARARPVLLGLGARGALDAAARTWADRVTLVEASYAGSWELPVVGSVSAPDAVLVRPDGHVAWVGEGSDAGLTDALAAWFGPPLASAG